MAYEDRRRELGFFSLEKVRDLTVVFHRLKPGQLHKRGHREGRKLQAQPATGELLPGTRPGEEQCVFWLCCFSLTERVKGSREQAHTQVGREVTSTFLAQIENVD